jgi:hypothetical protein
VIAVAAFALSLALTLLFAVAWQFGRASYYRAECERLRGVIARLTQSPEDP